MNINSIDGKSLKELARRSISDAFGRTATDVTVAEKQAFADKLGAFVTIKVSGILRGCIGRLDTESPLWEKIPELARAAAFEDNRFPPLRQDELKDTDIEVTLLGEPVEFTDLNEVEIGRDGLIIERGFNRGLLLPQVAVEHGWDLNMFLAQTCIKAGLESDAWESGNVRIYRFEGIVI
jgi:AmmeMemoRadiSam system protein A